MPFLKHASRKRSETRVGASLVEFIPDRIMAASYDVVVNGQLVGGISDNRADINRAPRDPDFGMYLNYAPLGKDRRGSGYPSLADAKAAVVRAVERGGLHGISARSLKINTRYRKRAARR